MTTQHFLGTQLQPDPEGIFQSRHEDTLGQDIQDGRLHELRGASPVYEDDSTLFRGRGSRGVPLPLRRPLRALMTLWRVWVRPRQMRRVARALRVRHALSPVLGLRLLRHAKVRLRPVLFLRRRHARASAPGHIPHRVWEALHALQHVRLVVGACRRLFLFEASLEGFEETVWLLMRKPRRRRLQEAATWRRLHGVAPRRSRRRTSFRGAALERTGIGRRRLRRC